MMARAPPSSSLASVPKGQRGIGSPGDPPAPPPPGQATALFYLLSLLQRAHDDRRSVDSLHTRKGTRPLTQTTQSGGGSTRLLSTLEWKTRYLSACLVRAASRVGGAKGLVGAMLGRGGRRPNARGLLIVSWAFPKLVCGLILRIFGLRLFINGAGQGQDGPLI